MARMIDADKLFAELDAEYPLPFIPEDRPYVSGYEFAYDIVKSQPTIEPKQELISVNDELPKKKREYLCVCQFGDDSSWRYYNVLLFHPEKNADNGCVKGPHFSNEGMDDMRVTHWMELPELPEREGE